MKRFSEQPSVVHIITTCFSLLYVLMFALGWFSILINPFFDRSVSSWATFIGIGLLLAVLGAELIRELARQMTLFWRWKSL